MIPGTRVEVSLGEGEGENKSQNPPSEVPSPTCKVQESYIVSRIHYFLEHSTVRQTPCLPNYTDTTSHVRYECTQFTSLHHLLYSNLIPQHPVPLESMRPNHSHQYLRVSPVTSFSPHLKDCPLYSRKLFCFSTFFYRSVTHRSPDLPQAIFSVMTGILVSMVMTKKVCQRPGDQTSSLW